MDLARYNSGIRSAVSFHGALKPINDTDPSTEKFIDASIIVCHGDADDHVNSSVSYFLQEMRTRQADFQFIAYSKALHGFTMHKSEDPTPGVGYDRKADERSGRAMLTLFNELYGIPSLANIDKFEWSAFVCILT